jgi:AraC-like DNA-binding protein
MPHYNSGERLEIIRPLSIPGIELLVAKNSSKIWKVFHETYTLCSCSRGMASWQHGGKEFPSGEGSNLLMEPGEMHCTNTIHTPVDFKVLLIDQEVVVEAATELGISTIPHLRHVSNQDPGLFWSFHRFCSSVEMGENLLEQQSFFIACIRNLLEHTERRPATLSTNNAQRAIERIKRYLQERFAEPVSLDELMALTGLSRYYLVHTFAKQIGMPPHMFQINIRIARACTLLKAGIPSTNVSTYVGFADQSHFTRHFKRVWGITPSHYAKAAKL